MDNKKIKICLLGFDWNNIGIINPEITISKLDRDGLRTDMNEFVMIFGGKRIGRKKIRETLKFSIWHFSFLSRFRILYDLFFIVFLPIVLIYENFKPDIFYLTDFPHILAVFIPAKFTGAKIYFRLVNLPTELASVKGKKGKIFRCYYQIMEKLAVQLIDRFIAINETTKKYLTDLGVSEEKIFIDIPDTIGREKEYIKAADNGYMKRKYGIKPDKKIILSVGSLIKEKGFYELIDAFTRLQREDLVLVICGDGEEKKKLEEACDKLGIKDKIIFAGKVGRRKIWNYYIGADVFTLFSKSESLGMVFWEAMHMGVPVIGTAVGGVKESIGQDGERGFYWKNDIKDFKEKIEFCLDLNNLDRLNMTVKAREYVAKRMGLKKTINEIYSNK